MKALNLIFLVSLISATSFAGNVNMDGSDCNNRTDSMTSIERLQQRLCESNPEYCGQLQLAGWNGTRDNSMSVANDDVGRSMAVMLMGNKITQGIQVCPGVYLATAHGALNGKANVDPQSLNIRAVAYPLAPENVMTSTGSNAQFISPRLSSHPNFDSSKMDSLETDYIFIRVDNPVRPNSFIEPLSDRNQLLVEESRAGRVDVHLYRGKTRYRTQADGVTPVTKEVTNDRGTYTELDQSGWSTDLGYMMENIYTTPLRVNQRCEISYDNNGGTNTDCPSEQSTSGSSYTTKINGQSYLSGLQITGTDIYSSTEGATTGGFIPSTQFCSDYESICGKPCTDLSDLDTKSVSL